MNDVIREWMEKAEGDYLTAMREIAVQQQHNYDAVCFHAQQCIEKLFKALLILHRISPGRTHNLIYLSQQLEEVLPDWTTDIKDLQTLTHASVAFRYPGETAENIDAEEAMVIATRLRESLLFLLKK